MIEFITADDGVKLAVDVRGSGAAIVLIPGLATDHAVYDALAERLSEHYLTLAIDQRGIGESDFAPGQFSMNQLAADVVAVISALAGDVAHVFGASMGGMVAQHVAINSPHAVRSLILAATTPGWREGVHPQRDAMDKLLGKGARTPEDAYRIAATVLYSPQFRRDHPDFVEKKIRYRAAHPVDPRIFAAQQNAVRGHATLAHLHEIHCPTLVMHGREDVATPVANAELLARTIPGAGLVIFDDCGHLFFHEEFEKTCAVIEDFLGNQPQ